jgi:NitT/TauT family transport system permease protein
MSSSDVTAAVERAAALTASPLPIPPPHSAAETRVNALMPGEGRVGAAPPAASDHPTSAPSAGLASPTSILIGSLGFGIIFLLVWQFLPPALGVPSYIIPTVTDLAHEFGRMAQRENLLVHILSTATIATVGFVMGSFLGAAMGYVLGMSVFIEKVLSPYILGLQIAPKVAFAPLFIMWLGYNAWPKLIVTVLVVFFPILVNVLQAMKTVDRDLINLARAYSMSRLQIFWKIEVPTSMPALMAGLRIGATLAVIGVTVGELVGGNTGLGYLITFGEGQANTAMVFNAIVLLTLIGIVLYAAVAMIEARVLHYIPRAMR